MFDFKGGGVTYISSVCVEVSRSVSVCVCLSVVISRCCPSECQSSALPVIGWGCLLKDTEHLWTLAVLAVVLSPARLPCYFCCCTIFDAVEPSVSLLVPCKSA